MIVLAQCKILIRSANDNFERNPYVITEKFHFALRGQELVLSECEHLQDLGPCEAVRNWHYYRYHQTNQTGKF